MSILVSTFLVSIFTYSIVKVEKGIEVPHFTVVNFFFFSPYITSMFEINRRVEVRGDCLRDEKNGLGRGKDSVCHLI